jgi:hypothetical protein
MPTTAWPRCICDRDRRDLAIENYKKSLEKSPKNEHARDKLKELEK